MLNHWVIPLPGVEMPVRLCRRLPLAVLLLLFVPLQICAGQTDFEEQSCAERAQQVQTAISESQSCATAADCTRVWLGCPFGCGTALRKGASGKIQKLVAEFNSSCSRCVYRCANRRQRLVCLGGTCSLAPGAAP